MLCHSDGCRQQPFKQHDFIDCRAGASQPSCILQHLSSVGSSTSSQKPRRLGVMLMQLLGKPPICRLALS